MFVNEARWVRGAVPFQGDIGSYRQYLINHEVGHAIGYQRHEACEANGKLAPIMMQQTFSTSNDDAAKFDREPVKADGLTCRFNPGPTRSHNRRGLRCDPLRCADVVTRAPKVGKPSRWPDGGKLGHRPLWIRAAGTMN